MFVYEAYGAWRSWSAQPKLANDFFHVTVIEKGLVAFLDRADERLLADGLDVVVRVALVETVFLRLAVLARQIGVGAFEVAHGEILFLCKS